jgi:peroxiredoxin
VDVERYVVLKDSTRAYLASSPTGDPLLVTETTTFSVARVGEPVPDSLFTFQPPEGAIEVEPEDALARGDTGLRGREASNFTLRDLEGREVSLESHRGRVVLINFWATWCGPCRIEMPAIEKLYREFADRELTVLAVDVMESPREVRNYLAEHGFSFTVLLDEDGTIAGRYGAGAIPTTIIIDREGRIVHHFVGARPEETLRQALLSAGL